jgi:hypothetical protein
MSNQSVCSAAGEAKGPSSRSAIRAPILEVLTRIFHVHQWRWRIATMRPAARIVTATKNFGRHDVRLREIIATPRFLRRQGPLPPVFQLTEHTHCTALFCSAGAARVSVRARLPALYFACEFAQANIDTD